MQDVPLSIARLLRYGSTVHAASTVTTWTGGVRLAVAVELPDCPIRTPTPIASSNVATPAINAPLAPMAGRRRWLTRTRSVYPTGAGGGRANRAAPRRSPHSTQ